MNLPFAEVASAYFGARSGISLRVRHVLEMTDTLEMTDCKYCYAPA